MILLVMIFSLSVEAQERFANPQGAEAFCADYRQGCMQLSSEDWRKAWNTKMCAKSCSNPCRFPGKGKNANEKPANFDVAKCEKECMAMQPVTDLLKPHSKGKEICIVIHHGGAAAKDADPAAGAQFSYRDAMSFDPERGDPVQKDAGGKCQWGDSPYHFKIDKFGNTVAMRSVAYQPDTNTRGELDTDGKINLMIDGIYQSSEYEKGDCKHVDKPDVIRPQQMSSLKKTIATIQEKFKSKGVTVKVTLHKWLADGTDCPGDDLIKAMKAAGIPLTGCGDDKHNPAKRQPANKADKCLH